MSDEHAQAEAVLEVKEQEVSLLDQIITENRIGRDPEQRAQSRQQIAALVDEVLQGTQIGGIVPPEGLKLLHQVINEALADNWDYEPRSFERWIEEETAAPGYDPTLWSLAQVAGEPAGAITASIGEDRGWVDYLGVRETHRGRGIAVALLHRAFAAFVQRGVPRALVSVDAHNVTGATAVYERAGMRPVKAWDMWERPWPWTA
jgi:GNAT superfamily N-acetyltransferase